MAATVTSTPAEYRVRVQVEPIRTLANQVISNVERVIIGKHREVELALDCAACVRDTS